VILGRIMRCLAWLLGLTLLVGTAAGFRSFLPISPGDAPPGGEGEATSSALPPGAITCLGYADGEKGVTALSPARPGCVAEVLVSEGDTVRAGASLLRLDDRSARFARQQAWAARDAAGVRLAEAREALRQYPARMAQQQAALEAARARLAAAHRLMARKEELLASRLRTTSEVAIVAEQIKELEALCRAEQEKVAEFRLHDAELAVRGAEAEVAGSQARLEDAEYAVDQCTLRAPEVGTVLRVLVGRGTMSNGASAEPAILFRPTGPLVVRAEVEQEFVGRLAVGQAAVVEDEFHAGGPWHGRVRRIADWHTQQRTLLQQPPRFTDVPTVECIIALDSESPPLRPGQRVCVRINSTEP
jgi:multidrug resistance efflux pump